MTEPLRVCDFFSGMHSWTEPLRLNEIPSKVFSIDNSPNYAHNTSLIADFLELTAEDIRAFFDGENPHVILASPPCTTFSVASYGVHWFKPDRFGNRQPKTKAAAIGVQLLNHMLTLIDELNCLFFFENPRGLMRKMPSIQHIKRHTVWYCQYFSEYEAQRGLNNRAKPTDIFTNSKTWRPRPECKNSSPNCSHDKAPRGSVAGTQALATNALRSLLPYDLCEEIMQVYLIEGGTRSGLDTQRRTVQTTLFMGASE